MLRDDLEIREAPDEDHEDQLAPITQAVNELRTAAEEGRQRLDERLTNVTGRLDQVETRLNRPGAGGRTDNQDDGEFRSFCRRGRQGGAQDQVEVACETRAMVAGDDTAGGYLAAPTFANELIKKIIEISPMRQIARVMSIDSDSVKFPVRTAEMTGSWGGETDASSETSPEYGEKEIFVHELPKRFVDVSLKLLEDSRFNIESLLAQDGAELIAVMEGAGFVNGTGVNQPKGFMNDPDVLAGYHPMGDASDIVPDGLIQGFYTLKSAYRRNAVWLMASATVGLVRSLKDPVTGVYLWQPSLIERQPDRFLGRPVLEDPNMPAVQADAFPIALGDFNAGYRVVDRINLGVLRDPYTQATTSKVRFHFRKRTGGDVTQPEAIRLFKVATS